MRLFTLFVPLALLALVFGGCSSSDGPTGPGDDNAVTDAMKTMSKEEKIKFYQNSPLPPAEKAAKLKELGAEVAPSNPAGIPSGTSGASGK